MQDMVEYVSEVYLYRIPLCNNMDCELDESGGSGHSHGRVWVRSLRRAVIHILIIYPRAYS